MGLSSEVLSAHLALSRRTTLDGCPTRRLSQSTSRCAAQDATSRRMRGASNKRNKKYAKERLVAIEAMAGKRERRKMEERREDCGEEVESLDLLLYTILYSPTFHTIPYYTGNYVSCSSKNRCFELVILRCYIGYHNNTSSLSNSSSNPAITPTHATHSLPSRATAFPVSNFRPSHGPRLPSARLASFCRLPASAPLSAGPRHSLP